MAWASLATAAAGVSADIIDQQAENPYPETREGIDRYKEHVIETFHEEICNYPEEVTRISTLEELFEYAGKSGVHVRMKPGIYEIGVDNCDQLWDGEGSLLPFEGAHSFFDLRGVEIKIDTYLNHTRGFPREVDITGNHLIIQGLTLSMVGQYPPGGENTRRSSETVRQGGSNNLIRDLKLTSRSCNYYGYGPARWYTYVVRFNRRSALETIGLNVFYLDCEIYQRANGYAVLGSKSNSHTWIDSYIEGETRLSDSILEETAGGFYDNMDSLPEKEVANNREKILKDPLKAFGHKVDPRVYPLKSFHSVASKIVETIEKQVGMGAIYPLTEDAFRSYRFPSSLHGGDKQLKILGGTVKDVPNAIFGGRYEKLFVSNTRFLNLGNIVGIMPAEQEVNIIRCKGDLTGRKLFRLFGGTGHELDLSILSAKHSNLKFGIKKNYRSAFVGGQGHEVVLKAAEGLDIEKVKRETQGYPLEVQGNEHTIRNEIGMPILLTEDTKDCHIITNGPVTDNGEGNWIERTGW